MLTEETAKKQLETLHKEGSAFARAFAEEEETEPFEEGYQRWYSRALPLMKQLAPDRYAEFQRFYARDSRYPVNWECDHVIQDFIWGRETELCDIRQEAVRCFNSQLAILKSVADRLAWSSLETGDQAERTLQLATLDTAGNLLKVSERAAGALAGTVLEAYLRKLAARHHLKLQKRNPAPRELVEALKAAKVFDVAVWSQATWLADVRSRCLSEGEAPTKQQVRDLVDGTRWLLTNVF